MKILIAGAGAVGGYFGALLSQAGRDVTFLVRPARAQQLQCDGLRILSPHGDLTIRPNTISTADIRSPYDLIFLSVKAQALDQAIKDMAPAVGPATMIYPVLNGIRHIDALVAAFGEQAVLGGVCFVSTYLDDQARIVQITPMQRLIYGERSSETTPRIRTLDETFSNAGFDTELSTAITPAMWQKWWMIAALGLVTCLLDGTIGQINAVPGGEEIALQATEECIDVVTAAGFPPPESTLQFARKNVTTKGSPLTASMYRDMNSGAPVEVETILGDLLHLAHTHNVSTPLLQAACVRLRVYQNTLNHS